ncbi:MAG: hypothetical protein KDK06_06600 [Gammaproteobacteria bacterium]|nr:hypothetical protein [Gammaproteobacteria bacterium]
MVARYSRAIALSLLVTAAGTRAAMADVVSSCVFTGDLGTAWSVAANWDCFGLPGPPNNAPPQRWFAVIPQDAIAHLDQDAAIDKLAIDSGGQLHIDNIRHLRLENSGEPDSGAHQITGTLFLDSVGNLTDLEFAGGHGIGTLSHGLIQLSNNTQNRIRGFSGGGADTLVLDGVDVRGAGQFGVNSLVIYTNALVDANVANPLVVDPDETGGAKFTNDGILQSSANGTLVLQFGTFDNRNGTIRALDDGQTVLSTVTVEGGQLTTGGNGRVRVSGVAVLDGSADLVNDAVIDVPNFQALDLLGHITNNGTINLQSVGNITSLRLRDDVTLDGNGTVNLSNNTENELRSTGGVFTLTNESNLLRGSGRLGANTLGLVNRGTVRADQPNALVVDPDDARGVVNAGLMEATAGGTLTLADGLFQNFEGPVDGTIQATDGTVEVNGATVDGGNVATHGSATLRLVNGTVHGGTLVNGAGSTVRAASGTSRLGGAVTFDTGSFVVVDNFATLDLEASAGATSYLNDGRIALNSVGNVTTLRLLGDVTLDGSGELLLNGNTENYVRGLAGTERLTLNGQLVHGGGRLGNNLLSLTLDANTVLDADLAGRILFVDPAASGDVTNLGLMRASNGGTLELGDGQVFNAGGTIAADDASRVRLSNVNIAGGHLDSTGSGRFEIVGNTVLDGIGLVNDAVIDVPNFQALDLLGHITNNGTINLQSVGNVTSLRLRDDVTLDGNGTVNLSNNSENELRSTGGVFTLTNESNLLRGSGRLGANTLGLVNRGTIRADQPNALVVDPDDARGFVNEGTLEAVGIGTLTLASGAFSTSGVVTVASTAKLLRQGLYRQTAGVTQVDGLLTATGGVLIEGGLLGGHGTVAGDVDNGGQVGPGGSIGQLDISGNYVQRSAGELLIEIAGLGVNDVLAVTGEASLGGLVAVDLDPGYLPALGDSFVFLLADTIANGFDGIACISCNGRQFELLYGTDFAALVVTSAVPLPPALWMTLGALVTLAARRRDATPGTR